MRATPLKVGTKYRITVEGIVSSIAVGSTTTWRIRFATSSLGALIIQSQAITNVLAVVTNAAVHVEALVLVTAIGASGAAISGLVVDGGSGSGMPVNGVTAPVTIDTTASHVLELTYISGVASASFQRLTGSIELVHE